MNRMSRSHVALATGGAMALSAAALAVWVSHRDRRVAVTHPPAGRLMEVDGVAVHVLEAGTGLPVVLIHGNNVSSLDFVASGLFDRLAATNRVIAIDRPGFGHTTRPRDRRWTPLAQARLIAGTVRQLGIDKTAVVGHSMGTLVALAWALEEPAMVQSLALLGGYFYPQTRLDALLAAPVAAWGIGDLMRYTVTALASRALLDRSVEKMFWPNDVPVDFFPKLSRELLLRPLQLRANAEDGAGMRAAARELSERYGELQMPLTLVAGEEDQVVDPIKHTVRLHQAIPQSHMLIVPATGHMVHYAAHDSVRIAVASIDA